MFRKEPMKENTMVKNDSNNYKYVFVCGLQRSGTSLLGRNVARLENCTGFKNTGGLQDEGQYLQDVYPLEWDMGGSGRFGFDPRAHLTETSSLLTAENVARLRASWHSHWDNTRTICVEKTPSNLLKTRFLQAAFPNSYFILIKRHPVAVSMATQRWKVSITSLHRMFEHWLHCHEIFEQDKKYLKHVYELAYEDYIENSAKCHEEIAAFLGTRPPTPPREDSFRYVTQLRDRLRVPECAMEDVTGVHNKKYFDRWSNCLTASLFRGYYRYIARKYELRFRKYGYTLIKGFGKSEQALNSASRISAVVGPVYCLGADVSAFLWRSVIRTRGYTKGRVKAMLPEFVLARIRQARKSLSVKGERI
ncbi:MAG: sulfotransferase [Verrucomicrobia bacterium]|nr:MAG: sulfotransferase [Verrucomicrobiota bacterium]